MSEPYIWTEDGRLSVDRFGCTLGDNQRGNEYSRRFWRQHDDATYTVITDVYGIELDEESREYVVTNVTEFTRCEERTDPGGTEIRSEFQYEGPGNYLSISRLRDAESQARGLSKLYGADSWDAYPGLIETKENAS